MTNPDHVLRNKLYEAAGTPWEGENITLQTELIGAFQNWSSIACKQARDSTCPFSYSDEQVTAGIALQQRKDRVDMHAQMLRDCFSITIDGWVPSELYEDAVAAEKISRAKMRGDCDSDEERQEFDSLWPFQDHDEID